MQIIAPHFYYFIVTSPAFVVHHQYIVYMYILGVRVEVTKVINAFPHCSLQRKFRSSQWMKASQLWIEQFS